MYGYVSRSLSQALEASDQFRAYERAAENKAKWKRGAQKALAVSSLSFFGGDEKVRERGG